MITLLAVIIAGMALEGTVLFAYHRHTGHGVTPRALLPNLTAGALLLIAMALAIGAAAWPWISLCLFGALIGHVTDLRARWIRSPS